MKLIRLSRAGICSGRTLEKIYDRGFRYNRRVENRVRKILDDVRLYGDDSVARYTRKFDHVKLTPKQFRVTEGEINGSYQNISADFISTLKVAMENVAAFYKKQIRSPLLIKGEDGVRLREMHYPLERIGVYVPGGTAPLVSTVYMTVVPARIAGVEKIVLATPPGRDGNVNPHILAVANLLKVDEIYKVGGVQAIAALAFGTKSIPRVNKIIGPGNRYVIEAKRQVFGYVDIEMLPGPSEVVIIANQHSNPEMVKADLLAQAEHSMGLSILVTTSKSMANFFKKEIPNGYVILVRNLDDAAEVVNRIAPEHLQIMVKGAQKILRKVRNAGAIFVGQYTPTVVGDYIAGPSHVLPTGGTARFFSALRLTDFMRHSHMVTYSKKALERVRQPIEMLAAIEGLPHHSESIKVRF
jgi:histidinol dehydrogenase